MQTYGMSSYQSRPEGLPVVLSTMPSVYEGACEKYYAEDTEPGCMTRKPDAPKSWTFGRLAWA